MDDEWVEAAAAVVAAGQMPTVMVPRRINKRSRKNKVLSVSFDEKALRDDTRFKQALKIRNPKNRLRRIYDACKSKKCCSGGDEPAKKSRGGCRAQQPSITVDGLKMVAEFKAPKKKSDEGEQLPKPVEEKQILSAERDETS